MELSLIGTLLLMVAAIGWTAVQLHLLSKRLSSLEKQYLALVADLEERLFSD